jgi:hypothetical protein
MQPQTDLKAGGDRLQCFSRLLTVAAHAFSFLTVVINVADVATDIAVCIAFWQEGETLWFGLVLASLLLSHLVYTVLATFLMPEEIHVWRPYKSLPVPLRLLVSLLIAQFVPFINFVLESYHDATSPPAPQLDFDGVVVATAAGNESAVGAALGQAADEEFAEVARSQMLNERLRRGIELHFRKFGLFYVETVVEAAPQAVIQLLAISFLGRATEAQLLSLCFSLFSITSKMVVLSRSYDARVMMFNFLLFAHDVFSTYYLFTTVIAVETARDVSLGSLHLSWFGYVWLLKVVITMGFAVVSGIAGLIIIVVLMIQDGRITQNKYQLLGGVLASVVLFAPAALVFEACKLSWWPLSRRIDSNARISCDPRVGLLVSFLSAGRPPFVAASFHLESHRGRPLSGCVQPSGDSHNDHPVARSHPHRSCASRALCARSGQGWSRGSQPSAMPPGATPRLFHADVALLPQATFQHHTAVGGKESRWNLGHAARFTVESHGVVAVEGEPALVEHDGGHVAWVLLSIWGGTACVMILLGQAVSFAYPFVNAGFPVPHSQHSASNLLLRGVRSATGRYLSCPDRFLL